MGDFLPLFWRRKRKFWRFSFEKKKKLPIRKMTGPLDSSSREKAGPPDPFRKKNSAYPCARGCWEGSFFFSKIRHLKVPKSFSPQTIREVCPMRGFLKTIKTIMIENSISSGSLCPCHFSSTVTLPFHFTVFQHHQIWMRYSPPPLFFFFFSFFVFCSIIVFRMMSHNDI